MMRLYDRDVAYCHSDMKHSVKCHNVPYSREGLAESCC